MNLTIEQMRKIVDGAPDWAESFNVYLAAYGSGGIPCKCDVLITDLRAAIADHDRTDHVSDIRNHIAPTTRVIEGMSGQKHDKQKPRMSLLPKGALNAVIRVLEFGATKYQENNWKHVPDAKVRYYDAMQRHIDAWWQGEQKDPETGEHHLAHAICCGMFLWWFDNQQSGVPEAILEAEKKQCHHHWVDGLDGGTMICAHKYGAWK